MAEDEKRAVARLGDCCPATMAKVCSDVAACHTGDYPTLGKIRRASGSLALAWLVQLINDLGEYCNVQRKMDTAQMETLASIIMNGYGHMKISELLLFFYRLKAGVYGEFYGAIDPVRITVALRRFSEERIGWLSRHEAEEAARRLEEDSRRGNCVTLEQWCAIKGIDKATLPHIPK